MPQIEPVNISANAGDEKALRDPNSPESISRRAQKAEAQASEDKRYDPPPADRSSGFQDYVIVQMEDRKRKQEITLGLFLALGTLLFLYKAAPDPR